MKCPSDGNALRFAAVLGISLQLSGCQTVLGANPYDRPERGEAVDVRWPHPRPVELAWIDSVAVSPSLEGLRGQVTLLGGDSLTVRVTSVRENSALKPLPHPWPTVTVPFSGSQVLIITPDTELIGKGLGAVMFTGVAVVSTWFLYWALQCRGVCFG